MPPIRSRVSKVDERDELSGTVAAMKNAASSPPQAGVCQKSRARTRAVYRKDRASITSLLQGQDRPGTDDDLARLKRLPATETYLALVKEHYANVRANVWFHGLDARSRGRVLVSAELPLLYPLGRSKEIPEIKYPPEEKGGSEEGASPPAPERAGKLETEPFLDTLPVYRYRLDHRRTPRR